MRRGGEVPLALDTQGPREEEVARPAYADKAYAYLSHVESFRGGAELPRVHARLRGKGGHWIYVTALLDSGGRPEEARVKARSSDASLELGGA